MNKVLILAATIAAALGLSVATAAATPQTPNLLCGASNMAQAWPGAGGVPVDGGMEHAMDVNKTNNTNGNDGMSTAVNNTAC
jgi:hypothetical protein